MNRKYGFSLDVGSALKDDELFDAQKKQSEQTVAFVEPVKSSSVSFLSFEGSKHILFFVGILVLLSVFMLSRTESLYNVEVNVRDNLVAQYRQSVIFGVEREFPVSPAVEKSKIVDAGVKDFVDSDEFDVRVQSISDGIKNFYRNADGQTYLYSSDPYYFFRLARNLVEFGMLGDVVANNPVGEDMIVEDSLRNFPVGDSPGINVFPFVLFYFFKLFGSFFSSFLSAIFYFPVFAGVLSVLCVFFIARKLSGDVGGFIAGLLFAVHPVFLFWNYAGYADTQILALFWSLLAILLFVYAIDLSNKKLALSAAVLLIPVLYAGKWIWSGLFLLPILFAVFLVVFFAFLIVRKVVVDKKWFYLLFIFVLLFASVFFVNFVVGSYFDKILVFLNVSSPVSLFPTAFSSITELEGANTFGRFVVALGGGLVFLVFLVEFLFFVNSLRFGIDKFRLFCFVWFGLMAVPAFLSVRFLFFVLPPFALIAGAGFFRFFVFVKHLVRSVLRLRFGDWVIEIFGLVLVCVIVFGALNPAPFVAKAKLPLMTKSIADASDFIRLNSPRNSVIATSWDLGYLWQAFARRATFFDGGLFDTPRLFWTSKILMAENELLSANVLRLLSCEEHPWQLIGPFYDWSVSSPERIGQFYDVLNLPVAQLKDNLVKFNLSSSLLCNRSADVFVVVSESMVYQSALFDSYSSWDFRSASVRKDVKGLSELDAVELLKFKYKLSEDDARIAFSDALAFVDEVKPKLRVDRMSVCSDVGGLLRCGNGFVVDLKYLNASFNGVQPNSLVVVSAGKRVVRDFVGSRAGFSVFVFSSDAGFRSFLMDSELSRKMIVRLFAGEDLADFERVFVSGETPERIVVYKLKK